MNQKGETTPVAERDGVFSIAELSAFLRNPRRHTQRNISLISRSLEESGALRGIVVDEDMTVLAGNGLIDAAADVGIHDVRVVHTEGDELVVVQVSHLDEQAKRRYALADNRTSELSDWDVDELREIVNDGVSLEMFWSQDELDDELSKTAFTPSMDPVASWDPVTEDRISSARELVEHRWEGARSVDVVEHTCPNCGNPVFVKA